MGKKYKKVKVELTLDERREKFNKHLRSYLIMNSFFVVFNLWATNFTSIGWAIWPLLGWGLGVAFEGLSVYGPFRDRDIPLTRPAAEQDGREHLETLPDLDDIQSPLELKELREEMERRTYRDEDFV